MSTHKSKRVEFWGKNIASERSAGWAVVYPAQTAGSSLLLDLSFRLLLGRKALTEYYRA